MDAFAYLSVLFSIIIGLSMTQILSGYRAAVLARRRVALHGPTLIWSGILLVIATQTWWASFGLAHLQHWTFLLFAVLLGQTVLLYMMAGLVLPDFPHGEKVSLEDHYRQHVTVFYLLLLAMLAASITKDVLLGGHLPGAANLAFHGVLAAIAILALAIRKNWLHALIAPVVAVVILAYITLLFARL